MAGIGGLSKEELTSRLVSELGLDAALNWDLSELLQRQINSGLLTRASLSTTYARVITESRGGQRVKVGRQPGVTVDQVFPNATSPDFTLVGAESGTLWTVATDTVLRKSTDDGATWTKTYYPGGLGVLAKSGLFFKTSAGTLLTTYHPFDLTAPKIMRSTDTGVTWVDVVAAQTDVDYLGPTSIAQDPVTGYLYLSEYVTASAATKATWKISRSTDDGATWATFHTFQRDATAFPTTAVRHGHFVQWDPVGLRIWFGCGDSEQAAGLYRVNAAGTDVEAVVTKAQIGTDFSAGAVSAMFFPNYIVWGHDQASNKGIIRMARTQIGQANPTLELVTYLQSTGFYAVRTKADNTEWLFTVSNENGSGGRLDNAMHVYRVSDDGATVDEVLTVPWSRDDSTFGWLYPVGGVVLQDGPVWLATQNAPSPVMPSTGSTTGYALRLRTVWGGQTLLRPDATLRRPHGTPVTVSSGNESLTALQAKFFGATEAPPRATRLYILEVTREQFSGTGFAYVEVYDQTGAAILKMEDATTDMQWQHRSRKAALSEASAPWIARSAALAPGRQIRFRVREVNNNTAEVASTITYAWGF